MTHMTIPVSISRVFIRFDQPGSGNEGLEVSLGCSARISLAYRRKRRILELIARRTFLTLFCGLALLGCGQNSPPDGSVRLDLESRRPQRLAEFYLGAYGDSARVASALSGNSSLFLNLDSLARFAPDLAAELGPAIRDGVVDREELAEAVQSTYARAIDAPDSLAGFFLRVGLEATSQDWVQHEVSGSMTRFRRRLSITRSAVRSALGEAVSGRGRMTYLPGTVVLGEHLRGSGIVETTAMIRRQDNFWDYYAYDSTGARVDHIIGPDEPLAVPIDCFGCHYGTRLFEPERSFPGQVGPGPHGERGIFVPESLRQGDVAVFLDEHRRRSDGLLGLYGTLYLSELLEKARDGTKLEAPDSAILANYRASR
ncbi:hypothetical protein JYT20_00550 [Rhodothermus sp. AH-315-K08]|nr:hypothetical protein [Rhodothermus sp. AH-315-K08]